MAGGAAVVSAQGGPVTGRVVDEETGRVVPARIRLLDANDREVVPVGHVEDFDEARTREGDVRIQSHRYCYTDGIFELRPGSLPLRYQVLKGFEYVMAEGELSEAQVRDGAVTIPLSRWSNISARGWYSGDIHIHHISPKSCRLEMDAEDLNVANILTSDFTTDQAEFEGKVSSYSSGKNLVYVNQEYRHDHLGHLNILNLKKLLEPVKRRQREHWPLHMDVCDRAHRQGGYVAWAHFPGGPGLESPLDVAMEKLDGLEISSQIEPRQLPTFMGMAVPEVAPNHGLHRWYRFLNCGFRLTATAGTDKMETFVTVGANRVFARLDGDFTYQGWIDALKAGRTFITNSPMLSVTVNGQEPGATLELESKQTRVLEIEVKAESQMAYDRLEIVANGVVIGQATPSGPRHRAEIQLEHPMSGSCWIAARAIEDLSRYPNRDTLFSTQNAPEGTLLSNYFGTRRPATVFAHSSPVYVIRDGEPIRSWDDAQYYVRYLDNSLKWLKAKGRFARPADRQATLDAFLGGRAIYEQRAREARLAGGGSV